jgi:hypothetical protein
MSQYKKFHRKPRNFLPMPSKSPGSIKREQDIKEILEFLKWLKSKRIY